jgi:hypothetical protein
LELTSPDVEACSTCISTEGTGSVTIHNPYIERHTVYGIHVRGTGFVSIRGGNVLNPTSQQDAIALDDCRNCTVDGVDTGTNGTGVAALHGAAPFINVNVRGVPANRVVDSNRYLQVSDAGPFSGSVVFDGAVAAQVVFALQAPHTLYAVTLCQSVGSLSPPWITAKTARGFQINFAAAISATVTWTVTI